MSEELNQRFKNEFKDKQLLNNNKFSIELYEDMNFPYSTHTFMYTVYYLQGDKIITTFQRYVELLIAKNNEKFIEKITQLENENQLLKAQITKEKDRVDCLYTALKLCELNYKSNRCFD